MEPQQPYQGFTPATYGAAPAYAAPASPQMLRPLSTGEVLDRTMALYRRFFWLFVGIGAVPALITTLSSTVNLLLIGNIQNQFLVGATAGRGTQVLTPQQVGHITVAQWYVFPFSLLFLIAYGVSKAATVRAVSDISAGTAVSVAGAYRAVISGWLRWTGIVLRQYWALGWPMLIGVVLIIVATVGGPPLLRSNPVLVGLAALLGSVLVLAGLVFGVLNYLRVALAEAAAVVEHLGVNASLRRSRLLVAGRKGRIFLAILLVYVLYMVAGGLQLPFVLLAQMSRGAAHVLLLTGTLVVGFVATSLVLPVASIALTMFYIDERVRREGYDIEVLLQRSSTPASAPPQL